MPTNLDGSQCYNRPLAVAMNLKMIQDPTDKASMLLVDMDDMITIQLTDNWCSGCQANVEWVGGRWTQWLGEPDKWYCEACK